MNDAVRNICGNELHPEYNGQDCACVWCTIHPEHNFCVEDPCEFCEGPVEVRCMPEEIQEQFDAIAKAKPISFDGEEDVVIAQLDHICQQAGLKSKG